MHRSLTPHSSSNFTRKMSPTASLTSIKRVSPLYVRLLSEHVNRAGSP